MNFQFPRWVSIAFPLTNLFLSRGRLDEALDSYRKAMIEEDWPESIEGYGRALLRAGRAREALVYLERALAKRPGHRPSLITYIQALKEAGQPEKAAILREHSTPTIDPPRQV